MPRPREFLKHLACKSMTFEGRLAGQPDRVHNASAWSLLASHVCEMEQERELSSTRSVCDCGEASENIPKRVGIHGVLRFGTNRAPKATKKPLPVFPEGAFRRVLGLELVDDVQSQEIRVVARAGEVTATADITIPPVFQAGDDIRPQGIIKRGGRADDFGTNR